MTGIRLPNHPQTVKSHRLFSIGRYTQFAIKPSPALASRSLATTTIIPCNDNRVSPERALVVPTGVTALILHLKRKFSQQGQTYPTEGHIELGGGPDIMIVADKLLTGFDEPKNTVLFADFGLENAERYIQELQSAIRRRVLSRGKLEVTLRPVLLPDGARSPRHR